MTEIIFRPATAEDVPAIVALYADDILGATRETPDDMVPYFEAFASVDADPNQHLTVADRDGEVVGTLQLTVQRGLARRGMSRATIEAVRVAASERGNGLGTTLMQWSIDESRRLGCGLVQLTSDNSRGDAHRFYGRLGFVQSHAGFKMKLDAGQ
jgi:GNAT superfamily N-acetyltransferase